MMNLKSNIAPKLKAHHYPVKLMGCGFVLTAVHTNPQTAWDAIRAGVSEIQRIERLISSWKPESQTSEINGAAGKHPIVVDLELYNLIERSLRISELTGGAFDISGNLARHYYNFNKQENRMPSDEKIAELCHLMNYKNIVLNKNDHSVFLKQEGMQIGFGGIGKGYAAYKAHEAMLQMGISSGLVNASGDLMAWGNPPNQQSWSVNIPDLENPDISLMEVAIPFGSIVTSGESENYTIINGTKHSHIIDPRTGRSARGAKSVSVLSTNPELCDALATAFCVLDVHEGLRLANQLNGVECIITDHNNKYHFSNHLNSKKS